MQNKNKRFLVIAQDSDIELIKKYIESVNRFVKCLSFDYVSDYDSWKIDNNLTYEKIILFPEICPKRHENQIDMLNQLKKLSLFSETHVTILPQRTDMIKAYQSRGPEYGAIGSFVGIFDVIKTLLSEAGLEPERIENYAQRLLRSLNNAAKETALV